MSWINELDGEQLAQIEPRVRLLDLPIGSLDDIALLLIGEAASLELKNHEKDKTAPGQPYSYWTFVRTEIFKLVCTDDAKYRRLRIDVQKKGTQATTLVVSVLSAALAKELGTTAGVLVPFCALCLYGSLKVGTAAYCTREQEVLAQGRSK